MPEISDLQKLLCISRSELGKITLDNVFRERDSLNTLIVEAINKAAEAWGIACLRYEISKLQSHTFLLDSNASL